MRPIQKASSPSTSTRSRLQATGYSYGYSSPLATRREPSSSAPLCQADERRALEGRSGPTIGALFGSRGSRRAANERGAGAAEKTILGAKTGRREANYRSWGRGDGGARGTQLAGRDPSDRNSAGAGANGRRALGGDELASAATRRGDGTSGSGRDTRHQPRDCRGQRPAVLLGAAARSRRTEWTALVGGGGGGGGRRRRVPSAAGRSERMNERNRSGARKYSPLSLRNVDVASRRVVPLASATCKLEGRWRSDALALPNQRTRHSQPRNRLAILRF